MAWPPYSYFGDKFSLFFTIKSSPRRRYFFRSFDCYRGWKQAGSVLSIFLELTQVIRRLRPGKRYKLKHCSLARFFLNRLPRRSTRPDSFSFTSVNLPPKLSYVSCYSSARRVHLALKSTHLDDRRGTLAPCLTSRGSPRGSVTGDIRFMPIARKQWKYKKRKSFGNVYILVSNFFFLHLLLSLRLFAMLYKRTALVDGFSKGSQTLK